MGVDPDTARRAAILSEKDGVPLAEALATVEREIASAGRGGDRPRPPGVTADASEPASRTGKEKAELDLAPDPDLVGRMDGPVPERGSAPYEVPRPSRVTDRDAPPEIDVTGEVRKPARVTDRDVPPEIEIEVPRPAHVGPRKPARVDEPEVAPEIEVAPARVPPPARVNAHEAPPDVETHPILGPEAEAIERDARLREMHEEGKEMRRRQEGPADRARRQVFGEMTVVPDDDDGPAIDARGRRVVRASDAAKVSEGLAELASTDAGRRALEKLERSGAKVIILQPGDPPGHRYDPESNTIIVDPRSEEDLSGTLAHEIHHAASRGELKAAGSSTKEEFLADRYRNEAEADVEKALHRRELLGDHADAILRAAADKEIADTKEKLARRGRLTSAQCERLARQLVMECGDPTLVFQLVYDEELKKLDPGASKVEQEEAKARAQARAIDALARTWGRRSTDGSNETYEDRYGDEWREGNQQGQDDFIAGLEQLDP
jgi:hypothetical protein